MSVVFGNAKKKKKKEKVKNYMCTLISTITAFVFVWFICVAFYDTSIIVDYLMQNPVYTYLSNSNDLLYILYR